MTGNRSYFSISFDLVLCEKELPYDLFVNSSAHKTREKFVRIFPCGGVLSSEDVQNFKKKYFQLYVPEDQRDGYLKSLVDIDGVEDVAKVEVVKDSAIKYLSSVFDKDAEITNEVLTETIKGCRDSVDSMIGVIEEYNINDIKDLIASLSFHDFYTYDHSINVAMYSISILKALKSNASKEELTMAGMGGLLHDLGKTKISTSIINNPGKLGPEEFDQIKKHPEYGNELIESHDCCQCEGTEGIDFEVIRRVVLEHHENYNGTGYPHKLQGNEIHVFARITAIADFYDAITTKRSYHEVMSTEDALQVMSRSVGRKIDPKIFDVFCKNVNVILNGKSNQELPDTFDPCQPHNVLPLQKVAPKLQQTDFFGKKEESHGKVKGNIAKKKAS